MIEIEFRALEKPDGMVVKMYPDYKPKMIYGTGVFNDGYNTWLMSHEIGYPLASGICGEIGDCSHCERHIIDKNTLGQYIGLKDINGKKIFVGDIVKHFNQIQHPKEYTVGKIIYDEKKLAFRKQNANGEKWDLGINYTYEIISNIYENVELMKGCE